MTDEETTETLLIGVRGCKNLKLGFSRWANPVMIRLGEETNRETDVGDMLYLQGREVVCRLTNQPCVLYGGSNLNYFDRIHFGRASRCPSFEPKTTLYQITGRAMQEKRYLFQAKEAKELIKVYPQEL